VELARRSGADERVERVIVKFVRGGDEKTEADRSGQHAELLEQVSRLEGFAELATLIARNLRAEIGVSSPEEG